MANITTNIELDVYSSIDDKGISTVLYVGEEAVDGIEVSFSWEDLVMQEFESHIIPVSNTISILHKEDPSVEYMFDVVDGLRAAADDLEERIRSAKFFIREDWVDAGSPDDRTPFELKYSEYLNWRMNNES